MTDNSKKNFTIVLEKINKKYGIMGQTNINHKINDLIKKNGQINYDDFDYECSYKTFSYGPCGATVEIDEINKIPNKK